MGGLVLPIHRPVFSTSDPRAPCAGCHATVDHRTVEPIATANGILLLADLRRADGDDRQVRYAVDRGELVRVHRGAYVTAVSWAGMDERDRYRHRVLAAGLASRSRPVLSHQSAAAVWGIPIVRVDTRVIHVLTTVAAGSRTEHGFRKHAAQLNDDDVVERDGVRVTSLARTLIDLARDDSFPAAVAAVDWGLRHGAGRLGSALDIHTLQAYFDQVSGSHRRRKVHRVLEFASPLAESPGESLSRAVMHELRLPAPALQHSVSDRRGKIGVTDFAWPEFRLLGEFDGMVKYTRSMARPGENVEDIVVREKVREDRMRATGQAMVRWVWSDALNPPRLRDKLVAAGLTLRDSGRVGQMRSATAAPKWQTRPDT